MMDCLAQYQGSSAYFMTHIYNLTCQNVHVIPTQTVLQKAWRAVWLKEVPDTCRHTVLELSY